jgi:hypothetical protein
VNFASSFLRASLSSALVLAACAPAREKPPASAALAPVAPTLAEDAGAEDDASVPPEKTLRPELAGDPGYLGVLERKGLLVILDQGLGRVLARLKLSPAMQGGRFEGFRVSAIDPAWSGANLQLDDVLLRLNGQPIERPEQAQLAFESLRVASEVALELKRAGEKMTLRYRIE